MSDVPTSQPPHSGDQAPFLVRLAERLSKTKEPSEGSLSIEKALWAMVVVQAMQMDTTNLGWLLTYLL